MSDPDLDFSSLRAVFINCTLKRSPEISNTDGLVRISTAIMEKHGVAVDVVRAVDHDIATGVWPDMREHGWATDDWPAIFDKVLAADILVLAGPIWLGDNSSVMKKVHERLYGGSHLLNDAGQYLYYGRVGGCLITGNEDGVKHCARMCCTRCSTSATPSPRRPMPVDRRGRSRAVIPRPRLRRAGERLHQPQHHIHDVEPDAPRPAAEVVGWGAGVRQHPFGVGRRLPVRLRQPRVSLIRRGDLPDDVRQSTGWAIPGWRPGTSAE